MTLSVAQDRDCNSQVTPGNNNRGQLVLRTVLEVVWGLRQRLYSCWALREPVSQRAP